jgi:hypothetical protein
MVEQEQKSTFASSGFFKPYVDNNKLMGCENLESEQVQKHSICRVKFIKKTKAPFTTLHNNHLV